MNSLARKRILRHLPILVLMLLNLLVGVWVVRDYGESWDEAGIYGYANQSIQAYLTYLESGSLPRYLNGPPNAASYGPAYAMLTSLLARGLHVLLPAWSHLDGWHLGEFLAFQLSVLSLYFLSRKWMGGWAAMGSTLLYSTQPLLWGHAFINPKDIPFLGFFLASITAGIYMVDGLLGSGKPEVREPQPGGSSPRWRASWKRVPLLLRAVLIAGGILYLGSLALIATGALRQLVSDGVVTLYEAGRDSLLGRLFSRLARGSTRLPVGDYLQGAQVALPRLETVYAVAGLLIGVLAVAWVFSRYFGEGKNREGVSFRSSLLGFFLNPGVLGAGCLLGFTTSIRVAGPYAGAIVLAYAFYKSWKKGLLLLAPYVLSALLCCYVTWPYLWGAAVPRFLASVTLMSHYPFSGQFLFGGVQFPDSDVPGYVLPALMSIQLTEAVPVLFLLGLGFSAWWFVRGRQREPFALTVLWFLLPLAGIIADRSTLYNNFRQELFLLPPVFLTAGIALEEVFFRVRRTLLRVVLLAAVILPGLYGDIRLHPYQYIYYNSVVGGVPGASGKFASDYWATSYREAAEYINQVAPAQAAVAVAEPVRVFKDYARRDLRISPLSELKPDHHYDFVVLLGGGEACPSIPPAKAIEKEGAVLTVIKAPPLSVAGCP